MRGSDNAASTAIHVLRSLLISAVCVAAQSQVSSSSSSPPPQGSDAAPFPNAVYPGFSIPFFASGAQTNQTSPPSYPSPWMEGTGDWAVAYSRAQSFVRQLTVAEKVNLTTGAGWETESCVGQTGAIPRLGFRALCLQDSPVGIRNTDFNSVFPSGVTVAATWDRKLMYLRGLAMGEEHRDKGSDVLLGPVVGPLGRNPAGGRNWEGFAPDPYLSGVGAAETIRGIQDAGVMACVKHLIGNEQEHFRQAPEAQGYNYSIDESSSSNVDDRTMHEVYLWPFADAVRAGVASVMCSYNQINNSYGCQNSYVLNHLLKGELGFQGFVVSDWGAQHSGIESALAGMDMAMPGDTSFDSGRTFWGTNLTIGVLNGTIPEWRIDDMATRIVAGWYHVGRDKASVPINFNSWTTDTLGYRHFIAEDDRTLVNNHVNVRQDHLINIRRVATAGTVLLKNNDILPLTTTERFTAVFGSDATINQYGPKGCPDRGCDSGTLALAWGSGTANFPYIVTPLEAIQNEVLTNGNGNIQGVTDDYAYDQISSLASQVSAAVVFVNSDSGEGYMSVDGNEGDRNNLTLWHDGDALIRKVSSKCSNTVVVIHSTGPVLVDTFYENPNVTAILWAGLPGEQSGNAITDILYGKAVPGGKLPFTIGASRQEYGTDVLYQPNNGDHGAPQVNFEEGPFIDYRAFDRANTTPIYEFGYGLSYTNFSYSDLRIAAHQVANYTPTRGSTQPAPSLGSPGSASDNTYPSSIRRILYYIYPYLNSTTLQDSSGDSDYGANPDSYLPPNHANGSEQALNPAGGAPGGNPQLYDVMFTVTASVKNVGSIAADEVPQLYVGLGGPDDPKLQLRGFERLRSIQPGQTAIFGADLTRRDISYWDVSTQNWAVSPHAKRVYVGSSSKKLPLSGTLKLGGSGGNGTLAASRSHHNVSVPTYGLRVA